MLPQGRDVRWIKISEAKTGAETIGDYGNAGDDFTRQDFFNCSEQPVIGQNWTLVDPEFQVSLA